MKTSDYYKDITESLKPLSLERRLDAIASAIELPLSRALNKEVNVKGVYDKSGGRCYLVCNGRCIDFHDKAIRDLRWDILIRAFELLEEVLIGQDEWDKYQDRLLEDEMRHRNNVLNQPVNNIFASLTEDEVVAQTAKELRGVLGEAVEYGYDAIKREFFFNVPKYSKSVAIQHKYLRDHRWDLLLQSTEALINAVNKEREVV